MTTLPTPLQAELDERLARSAEIGCIAEITSLLAQGADPKHNNSAPLSAAAKNGHAECVKALIPISYPGAMASRALYLAASGAHAGCVKLLIPVSDPKARDSLAIRAAATNGATESLRLLIPVSDLPAALRISASGGHLECVRLLISCSDRVDHASSGFHSLRMAIEHGHFECANLLIELCSLSAEPRPFHEAIAQGQAKATAFMLAREPSLIDTIDPAKLILDAENNDHGDMASLLLSMIESRALSSSALAPSKPSGAAPRL